MRPGLIALFFAGMLSWGSSASARPPRVCLDAGHGGKKVGALGPTGQQEKEITLALVRKLRAELLAQKVEVFLTRDADVEMGLRERIERANAEKADIFISVHCNAMAQGPLRARARGVETYFLSAEATGEQARKVAEAENSEATEAEKPASDLSAILDDLTKSEAHREASALAYAVHQRLVERLGAPNRGVHQAPFLVLSGARMPAILVEVGYISNAVESTKLSDPAYHERIARGLADGIAHFWRRAERGSAMPVSERTAH